MSTIKKLLKKFKRAKITPTRSDKNVKSTSSLSVNEYYRNLLQQFANHCQTSNRDVTDPDWLIYQRNEQNIELSPKKNAQQEKPGSSQVIPGIPHVQCFEILEIGSVAGTENRYLELISAEWRNTKVSLKRHTFKGCQDAIKADVEILSEIRHPNILLLMATTHTIEHDLVSIFEPVNCTLYNYIHVQGERMNIQGTIEIGIRLADVLKYCHMRGYIHSALSSHCVYFTSDATVKLGGWELARKVENFTVDRDYEKYLRLEIDKWQAPETSYGQYSANIKSDVYCLMLLLWEMCTGCVPCDGNDRSDVEPEYVTRNHSVSLRNVPSLLRNLLETGLQLDEAKRTLNMDKIGRELHRLLVIHEYKKNSANECETNNNDSLYDILNIKTSSPVSPIESNVKSFAEQSYSLATKFKEPIHQFVTPVRKQRNRDSILDNEIEKIDSSEIGNDTANSKSKVSSTCTNCAKILNIVQDIDKESNVRADIKRLKQLIASQRERFFLGTDSSSCDENNPKVKSAIPLKKSTSFDYITCKPASHTITMEPRFNRSLNEYDGNTSKSSCIRRKAPYMSMPASIKDAIMQRQVLHPDTKSFYESTLWRKEKEICLSRMGRDRKEHEKISSPLQRSRNSSLSTIGEDKTQYPGSDVTRINNAHSIEALIKDNNIGDTESVSRNIKNTSTRLPLAANKSIQDLKNALERATEIVRSITPTRIEDLEDLSEKQECERAYDDLYDSHEIPIIEKATSDNKISYMNGHTSADSIEAMEYRKKFNEIPNEKLNSLAISFTRTSKKSQKLMQSNTINEQSTDSSKIHRNETVLTNGAMPIRQQTGADFEVNEEKYVNVPLVLSNLPTIKSHVSSPFKEDPTKMDCLNIAPKNDSYQTTRCTTEDLYIDDELEGSNLNYNLILVGDDYEYLLDTISCDVQELLQTTEL